MKPSTVNILTALKVLAWMAFIGYAIECGSQVVSLLVSLYNPAASKQLMPGVHQSLQNLYQFNTWYYIYAMSFVIGLSAMKAHLGWLVINLWSAINLATPFSRELTSKLEKLAYQLLSIWVVSIIGRAFIKWLSKSTGESLDVIDIGDEFLYISGIVYLISQVFRRGIELQEENQLTV